MNDSDWMLYNMTNSDLWNNITEPDWYDNITDSVWWDNITDSDWMVKEQLESFANQYYSSKQLLFISWSVAINVIGVLGLLSNTLVLLVLSRPQMRSSFNLLLLALAVCDIGTILAQLLVNGLSVIYYYSGTQEHWLYFRSCIYPHVVLSAYPLINLTQTMSMYLSIVVSTERWMAVRLPFRAKTLFTYSRSRWYIFATVTFAFAYNAPRFFEMEIRTLSSTNNTIYYIEVNEIFNTVRRQYKEVYLHWIYLVVMFIVPFSVLAVMNACIVWHLHRARAERAQLTHVQRNELSLTTMMLVDVLVYTLCYVPSIVNRAFLVYIPENNTYLLHLIGDFLGVFNNSINIIIYIIFGQKFRHEFLKMFA